MEAYVAGLEKAHAAGRDLSKIHSVASFFVSRVDTEIDKRLEANGSDEALALRGKAGVANARLAYHAFQEFFSGERWEKLEAAGARRQRPLWASTGVKNPEYRDTMYVTDLVVADTVNTMPEKTMDAFAEHGEVEGDQITTRYDDARAHMDALAGVGIDYDDVIAVLEKEGVDKFVASWNELLDTVSEPARAGEERAVSDAPVDPTTTQAWSRLAGLADGFAPDLRAWFADDPGRADRLAFTAGDLHVDLSKNLVDEAVLAALLALAEEVGLTGRRDAMFAGEHINVTEDRAVLHTALRRPAGSPLEVDGQDADADVHDVLRRVYDFAERVRSGAWTGVTGERIRTVVNIGIGGSDLGPVMAYEALAPYRQDGLECRFISNIDPTDAAQKLAGLDPASTLFIVSSKTFGTLETLTNARLCKQWLLDGLRAARQQGRPTTRRRWRGTSSRCPPRSTRWPTSASTPRTPSASGTGWAAATPSTPRSVRRSWSRSGRSASPSCWPGCTPSTSTSAPPTWPPTCRPSWGCSTSGTSTSSAPTRMRCFPTPSSCTGSRRTSSS